MCWSISVRCGMLEAATRLGVASYLRRIYGSAVHEEASRFPGRGVRVRARGCELLSSLHDARAAVQPEQRLGPVRTAATTSPTIDPGTALTSKNGQSGPSAQSGTQDGDTSVVVVALEEGADSEATLASINETVAASFPGASVSVECEYRNALSGYALRVPDGSLDTIRSVSGVQAVYLDGNNRLH